MTTNRAITLVFSLVLTLFAGSSFADHQHRGHRGHDRHQTHDNHYVVTRRHDSRAVHSYHSPRHVSSFTSEAIRGGSSRRTRIIENPYANRIVTGITIHGIGRDYVHIEDVMAYPYRKRLSPLAFTLSKQHPPRYIRTNDYIEYISVAAKRKEYFVVTFHYD